MRYRILYITLGFLATFLLTQQSGASLGGSVDSIESDLRYLSAVRGSTTTGKGYEIQEIHNEAIVVREYLSPSGRVFGIAWDGPVRSGLGLGHLLGSYMGQYEEALRRTKREPGHPYLEVKAEGVVVEEWGLVGNLHGRAYAPGLVPPDVPVDAIK